MKPWQPFKLMPLPVQDWREDHVRACQVCREKRYLSAVALHEATHLAVATAVGVEVEFCSIDDSQEIPASALEASLYGLAPGFMIPAVLTRIADDSLDRMPKRTLVAMVAPSCVVTGDEGIDAYAEMEAEMGVKMAEEMGIDPDEVLDRAKLEVERTEADILRYAERLAREGRIDLTDEKIEQAKEAH